MKKTSFIAAISTPAMNSLRSRDAWLKGAWLKGALVLLLAMAPVATSPVSGQPPQPPPPAAERAGQTINIYRAIIKGVKMAVNGIGNDAEKNAEKTVESLKIRVVSGDVDLTDRDEFLPNEILPNDTELSVIFFPEAKLLKREIGIAVDELKIGDALSFQTKPIKQSQLGGGTTRDSLELILDEGMALVTSLNPLTLQLADAATLTFSRPDWCSFTRHTVIKAAELAAGQTLSLHGKVQRNGFLKAGALLVVVEKAEKPLK